MIEVKNLTRYYGEFAALKDVSFSVTEGQVVGLLGLNGSGKSTTLKCLAGLLAPSGGTVTINGINVVDAPDSLKASIGFLPETPPLYTDMTVTGFLRHVGRLKGMSGAAIEAALPRVIAIAQLEGRENQLIGTLSHGFRKRVGIAQTVIHDPKLVILDEPISGLDPKQIVEMRKVVRSLGQGRVVMISSHNLAEISQTCDRILVLEDGALIAEGSESELAGGLATNRIVVTVRAEPAAFMAWLADQALVKETLPIPTETGFAQASVTLTGDVREDFIPELVKAGFRIRLIEDPDDELEEIFLSLMSAGGETLTL